MKYRIFASLLVLAALAAAAIVFGDASTPPAAGVSPAPTMGADDKALKSLSIN